MAMESSHTDVYMMGTVRGLVEYIKAKTQMAQIAAPTLAPPSPTLPTGARNRLDATVLPTRRLADKGIVLQGHVHLMLTKMYTASTNHASYCQLTLTEAMGVPRAAKC